MRRRRTSRQFEIRVERDDVVRTLHTGTLASAPGQDEIVGYGSNCRWSHRVHDE
jgi:hypothetical protein